MTKRININFDPKSIKEAIAELKSIQRRMESEIPSLFLDRCLDEIIARANQNVMMTDLDGEVKANITDPQAWHKNIQGSSAVLTNNSDKAVYIEFGVGVVGQQSPHPNTAKSGYMYNVPSHSKIKTPTMSSKGEWMDSDEWMFNATKDVGERDIMDKYIIQSWSSGGNEYVLTSGQPAQLYLYNAMMDMQTQGVYKRIWDEVLDKNL